MSRPPRKPRQRGSLHYDKPALSLDKLIERLSCRCRLNTDPPLLPEFNRS